MRAQEKAVAGAHRGSRGGDSVGDRLPSAPRERKPALAALAVLLILVGALGATMLVMQAGNRVEAVRITERVPAGQHIPQSAIEPVMVAEDSAVQYVLYSHRELLKKKYRSSTDLVKGTVLVAPMLTEEAGLASGEVVVGLSLSAGQYPTGLKEGDTVAAYRVGGDARGGDGDEDGTGTRDELLVNRAKVAELSRPGESSLSSDLPVSLRVRENEAAALTKAAAAGAVSLVIVPATD
ncbi:hypothetical protein JJV70_03475 [Streptomyces sp. JJ66]|uniref:hypothetical protein n=1 Tax=Streptomyces sp. JJ66 TaxID=2803843 RepID=UPI001C580397|nr:hypothetical protein [Streptomyces sp. JJ66]MBW1601177.1 hypothetical protein [Streptomyces sp. JJ66]